MESGESQLQCSVCDHVASTVYMTTVSKLTTKLNDKLTILKALKFRVVLCFEINSTITF